MDLVDITIIGLASWRVASMLVHEDGPALIFQKVRDAAGLKPGPVSGFFPTLFSCMYCMSVWTTIAAFLLYLLFPVLVMLIAAMSVSLIVHKLAGLEE